MNIQGSQSDEAHASPMAHHAEEIESINGRLRLA